MSQAKIVGIQTSLYTGYQINNIVKVMNTNPAETDVRNNKVQLTFVLYGFFR